MKKIISVFLVVLALTLTSNSQAEEKTLTIKDNEIKHIIVKLNKPYNKYTKEELLSSQAKITNKTTYNENFFNIVTKEYDLKTILILLDNYKDYSGKKAKVEVLNKYKSGKYKLITEEFNRKYSSKKKNVSNQKIIFRWLENKNKVVKYKKRFLFFFRKTYKKTYSIAEIKEKEVKVNQIMN